MFGFWYLILSLSYLRHGLEVEGQFHLAVKMAK